MEIRRRGCHYRRNDDPVYENISRLFACHFCVLQGVLGNVYKNVTANGATQLTRVYDILLILYFEGVVKGRLCRLIINEAKHSLIMQETKDETKGWG